MSSNPNTESDIASIPTRDRPFEHSDEAQHSLDGSLVDQPDLDQPGLDQQDLDRPGLDRVELDRAELVQRGLDRAAAERAAVARPIAGGTSVILGVVAVTAVLALGGLDLYLAERVKTLRDNANQLQRQMTSIEGRVGRLELQMEQRLVPKLPDSPPPAKSDGDAPANGASRPAAFSVMLTQAEIDTVRDYIKTPPATAAAPSIGVGMSVAGQPLIPLPTDLVDRVPKLAGARFKTDRNGAIAIVLAHSDRVDFIIPPR